MLLFGGSVLEFGAAAGLPSLTAAINGASFVCATDYPDDPLINNIHANFQDATTHHAISPNYIDGFLWGGNASKLLEANGGYKYDLIILSDLLFNHTEQKKLLKSCQECRAESGQVTLHLTGLDD